MALITFTEIVRMFIVIFALGYIFSAFIPRFYGTYIQNLKLAILISAPGIIFHELAHKFTALALGLKAEFFASYFGLTLGILLKAVHAPFLIIVPGYVEVSEAMPLQMGAVALAGPLVNLALWLGASFILKRRRLKRKQMIAAYMTSKINMILFLFNMIPFGFFDGAKVLRALLYLLGH